jgi:hypothetical protein
MEALQKVAERINEAVMGAPEPVSLEGAPAMVCIKTYMPNPGKERELLDALQEHFRKLKEADLVRTVIHLSTYQLTVMLSSLHIHSTHINTPDGQARALLPPLPRRTPPGDFRVARPRGHGRGALQPGHQGELGHAHGPLDAGAAGLAGRELVSCVFVCLIAQSRDRSMNGLDEFV